MMWQILLLVAVCSFASSIPVHEGELKNTIIIDSSQGISDLSQKLVYFLNEFDAVQNEVKSSDTMELSTKQIMDIFDMLKKLFEEFKELTSAKFEQFVKWIVKNWKIFIQYIDNRAQLLQALVKQFINDIKNMDSEQIEEALQFVFIHRDELFTLLKDIVAAVATAQSGNLPATAQKIVKILKELDNLVDQIPELKDTKFRKFLDWASEAIDHPIQTIEDLAKEFLKNVPKDDQEVMKEAEEFFSQFKDVLGPLWKELEHIFHPNQVNHYNRRN